MVKKTFSLLLLVFLATAGVSLVFGWGFWAHQRINKAAVFSLPDSMRTFFYNHIDFITEEAVMPDVRIYAINYKQEVNRHFIDLELLERKGEAMPATLPEAIKKYGDSLVQKAGILPWYIEEITGKLTTAFKEKNRPYILFQAADLAHYLGDAHVPLHTTVNHDGDMTGQKGIHSFWESQLPESVGNNINFYTRPARYIADIKKETWRIINESHTLVDSLLLADKALKARFPAADLYQKDSAGNIQKNRYNQTRYSYTYAQQYNQLLNGMIERQIRKSVSSVGDFWYTAWVNAGSPDLRGMDAAAVTNRNRKAYKKDIRNWKKGQLFGFKNGVEF